MFIVLGLFCLLAIVFFGLSLPSVQTKLAQQLAASVNKTLLTNFKIDKVAIYANGTIAIKGVYVGDHRGDTLMYAKSIGTSATGFQKITSGSFDFDDLTLSDVNFNIIQYQGEEINALKTLINTIKSNASQKEKKLFKAFVEDVVIDNGRFQFVDYNKTESAPLVLDSIYLKAKDLNILDDFLELKIADLSLQTGNDQLPVDHLKGKFIFDPCTISLTDFNFQTAESFVEGSVILENDTASFKDFFNAVSIKISVQTGEIHPETFFPKLKYTPKNDPFYISFDATGKLNSLNLKTINIKQSLLTYKGSLLLTNLFDPNLDVGLIATADFLALDLENYSKLDMGSKGFPVLKPLKEVNIIAKALLKNQVFALTADLNSNLGSISINSNFGLGLFNKKFLNTSFNGRLLLDDIEISKFLRLNNPIGASGILSFDGNYKGARQASFRWKGTEFKLYNTAGYIDQIAFQGEFSDGIFKNTFKSDSALLNFKSDQRFDFSKPITKYSLAINLIRLDLVGLGINIGGGRGIVKAVILGDFSGSNVDDLNGAIKLSSLSFENKRKRYDFNPISITNKQDGELGELAIENTDFIQANILGKYHLSQIRPLFQNVFQEVYTFLPDAYPSPNQTLDFNIQLSNKILAALYPDVSVTKNISIKGKINSEKSNSNLSVDLPFFSFGDYAFENFLINIDTKNPLYNTYLSFDRFKNPRYTIRDMDLISTSFRDTLFFRSEFNGENRKMDQFELNFYHVRDTDGISHFGLKKSNIVVQGKPWLMNPLNESSQIIRLDATTNAISTPKISFKSSNQTIDISGSYLNENKKELNASLKNIILEDLISKTPSFKVEGIADLNLKYIRSKSNNTLTLNSSITDLNLNDLALGDFEFKVGGNSLIDSYLVSLNLHKGNKSILLGQGSILGLKQPTLDFDLSLNTLNIGFLSRLGKNSVNNIRGLVSGNINLWGALNNLQHSGKLQLKDGGLGIPYLNVDYGFEDTAVALYNQVFDFGSLKIIDTEHQTSGILKAKLFHSNFKNWGTDLSIASDRILMLNKPQEEEALFFGNGYLDGNIAVAGPMSNLAVMVDGATEKGTSIKIPWSEDYGISDTSYISFVDKNKLLNNSEFKEDFIIKEIEGLEMKFDLDVNNNAAIEIVIDKETGSYLDGRGSGNILMEINTKGKFNMWGDFITFGGVYNFKNLSVIDKKFNVKPGGTIVWEGDPLAAQMNLEAVYEVPGGANPALLLDNPNFNKKIPTEVVIRLQGNLLKPDDPIFEIDFPNTSNTVVSEINYRLSDPQRSQLQAISLLSQGIFVSEVGVSMQGITNNLYQKASDVFSSLLGQDSDKLKVGVDFLQGDKSSALEIATEDRLGITLVTQISDRILLNGRIGVPVSGVEETLIVGNVQIDFILNKEGSLKAKVFNRENEFRYLTDELGYTQGVGFSYEVDFNTFRELISKITKRENPKSTTDEITNDFKNSGINFIKKE